MKMDLKLEQRELLNFVVTLILTSIKASGTKSSLIQISLTAAKFVALGDFVIWRKIC